MGEAWKCNIEDWDTVDEGKVRFIMEESKLYLKCLFEAFEKLDQKVFIFLGVLFTVISALTGFFVSKYSLAVGQNWKFLMPSLIIVLMCFVACFFLIRCILPKSVISLGNETKNLLNKEVCRSETRLIMIGEVLDYQSRIEECKRHLVTKTRDMRRGLTIAFLAPVLGGLCALIL